MVNKYLRELLSSSDLEVIHNSIKKLEWVDAALDTTKVCDTAVNTGDDYGLIDKMVFDNLSLDNELTYITQPKSTTNTRVNRMNVGGKYDLHIDSPHLGHYSTTTFLSDPSTYDGGELVLHIDGENLAIKPEAGWAITYLTGIPHTVKPVTRGTRLVCVNWTVSEFSNPVLRDFSSDIHRCKDLATVMGHSGKFEDDLSSPVHILSELHFKVMRLVL